MIIERKYCRIYDLLQDDPSREVFYKAFANAGKSDEQRDEHLATIGHVIFYEASESSALPNIMFIRAELDKLDTTTPFDNGLTYRDVNHVDTFPSRKGKAMALILRHITVVDDMIVQVIAIEDTDHGPVTIAPWDVPGRI